MKDESYIKSAHASKGKGLKLFLEHLASVVRKNSDPPY